MRERSPPQIEHLFDSPPPSRVAPLFPIHFSKRTSPRRLFLFLFSFLCILSPPFRKGPGHQLSLLALRHSGKRRTFLIPSFIFFYLAHRRNRLPRSSQLLISEGIAFSQIVGRGFLDSLSGSARLPLLDSSPDAWQAPLQRHRSLSGFRLARPLDVMYSLGGRLPVSEFIARQSNYGLRWGVALSLSSLGWYFFFFFSG